MKINAAGLALLKGFEQCRLDAYLDAVGIKTIGWGHTGDDFEMGDRITQAEADQLLADDLSNFEEGVSDMIDEATDNQFSALVCFAYNVGLSALKNSTLLKKFEMGDNEGAAAEFIRWNKAKGKVLAGLTRRREAEADLFLA